MISVLIGLTFDLIGRGRALSECVDMVCKNVEISCIIRS